MTRKAFENAITVVIALGGSTNAVLHLLAMAHACNVKLALDDFTRIGKRVPVLADLKPSGKHFMSELVAIGGIRPLMKTLLDAGLLHGDCLTVTGQTMAETLARCEDRILKDRRSSRPGETLKTREPPGDPARQSGARGSGGQNHRQGGLAFLGQARVFDSEERRSKKILAGISGKAT